MNVVKTALMMTSEFDTVSVGCCVYSLRMVIVYTYIYALLHSLDPWQDKSHGPEMLIVVHMLINTAIRMCEPWLFVYAGSNYPSSVPVYILS